jgi:hypothetical protein
MIFIFISPAARVCSAEQHHGIERKSLATTGPTQLVPARNQRLCTAGWQFWRSSAAAPTAAPLAEPSEDLAAVDLTGSPDVAISQFFSRRDHDVLRIARRLATLQDR